MIHRQQLLSDLQALLKKLETDLLERSESTEIPDVGQTLRAEYDRATKAERTAQNYEDWLSDAITQAAAAWVLSCVFVRFLEDNRLIDPPRIAGPKERLQQARDEHTLYFQDPERAKLTDREYLLTQFDELAQLPGTRDVFGQHNPIRELPNWLSGDAAGELLRFFQKIDANTGDLIHDFTDPEWDTRFLGDLYQDLSEAARKKYALLQTPEFVEEFILDRTLEPALDEFGLEPERVQGWRVKGSGFRVQEEEPETRNLKPETFKIIDPACGSGHFLLGAFPRILDRWQKQEPGGNIRDLVQKTLDCIHGVDVNPYAIAIARFRLLLMAMKACGIRRLTDAPGFHFNLACGDSLLHAPLRGGQRVFDWELASEDVDCEHAYQSEDLAELKRMLRSGIYHAVVANPPYITPKDRQLNQRYRKRFEACHMKYSLAVPFMERIFRMAVDGGFTGQITANSFMKREFGKKLIEQLLPQLDLTHVIDTSGAYIPGHGTPTVILLGRHRQPLGNTIRTAMGIRGEPATPADPAQGLVWRAIVEQLDRPGSQSEFVSVGDSERERFHSHPWSIGGGGAAELQEALERDSNQILAVNIESVGFASFSGTIDVFFLSSNVLKRHNIASSLVRRIFVGESVREWRLSSDIQGLVPYDSDQQEVELQQSSEWAQHLWAFRSLLENVVSFGGKTRKENGDKWWTWYRWQKNKYRNPRSIVYADIATHNHFFFDRERNVFDSTAPVIKLSPDASEDDHLALLGLLNSSVACFWMKQVCFPKGGDHVGQEGARVRRSLWDERYAFNATNLQRFPLPKRCPTELARRLDKLGQQLQATTPEVILRDQNSAIHVQQSVGRGEVACGTRIGDRLRQAQQRYIELRGLMIFLQEELDWACYQLYGLIDEDLTYHGDPFPLAFGERSFEILLARNLECGSVPPTTWFQRHNATPLTDPPEHWPAEYNALFHRRHEVQQENANIQLIEQPEYKRRWNTESWDSQVERALRAWLLNRLESYFDFDGRMNDEGRPTARLDIALTTIAKLADLARSDSQFMEVGEVYRDDAAFDVQRLVEELVQAEQVPLLPALRYKPSGLRKRLEWEKAWELQRREDAIDARTQLAQDDSQHLTEDQARDLKQREIGDIPVPPKYKSSDFISTGGARYWALRGKLDVPKERWVSFPHCEGPDGTLVIAWAGYDHLQLARVISAYFVDIQERLGGRDDPRLVPLLACIIELLPWLKQWHGDLDPDYNQRMDEVFEGFVSEEAKNLGLTIEEIKAWEPPKKTGSRKKRRAGK